MLALAASLLLVIVYAPAAVRARGIFTILYPLWKSTLFLRAGMLVFLFLFAFLFGTRVRDFRFGIAAGFGVEALIILVEGVLNPRWKWISYVDTGASLIAGTIWFLYLVVPRTSTRFSGDLTGADSVARWKGALSEFLQK
jgi:hypothetical protein